MFQNALIQKMTVHLNLEFVSAGAYLAAGMHFSEIHQPEIAECFRLLAQSSVIKATRCFNYIKKQHLSPFINNNTPRQYGLDMNLKALSDSITADYNLRTDHLREMETMSMINNDLKSVIFLGKIMAIHKEEGELLISTLSHAADDGKLDSVIGR